jgi:hypothetical protein
MRTDHPSIIIRHKFKDDSEVGTVATRQDAHWYQQETEKRIPLYDGSTKCEEGLRGKVRE